MEATCQSLSMTGTTTGIARPTAALAAAETRADAQTARADMTDSELAGARGLVSAAEVAIQHPQVGIARLRCAR